MNTDPESKAGGRPTIFAEESIVMFKIESREKQLFQKLCSKKGESMSDALRRMVKYYNRRNARSGVAA